MPGRVFGYAEVVCLFLCHTRFRLGRVVVVTEKMQEAVAEKEHDFLAHAGAMALAMLFDGLQGDDDVAEHSREARYLGVFLLEGEHVGGPWDATVGFVELGHGGIVAEQDADFGVLPEAFFATDALGEGLETVAAVEAFQSRFVANGHEDAHDSRDLPEMGITFWAGVLAGLAG